VINDWNGTPSTMGQPEHDRLASYGGCGIPSAPSGLSASAGNAQVSLSWNAPSCATAYDVKRSTVSGSGYATVSSPTSTSYTDTGLTNGTTYYYVVDAKDSAGTSGNSAQASATPTSGGSSGTVSINSGGPAVSPFVADVDFSGGAEATNWTGTIDTSAASNPAPQAVYQSERYGANTYTIGGLTANTNYTVRLHFCENYFTASGLRVFNVSINGTSELSNFDIYATAGAIHKAVTKQYTIASDANGNIAVAYTNVTNNALSNGVEVLTASGSPPAAPTGLAASAGNAQVSLTWNSSSGATSYNVYRGTTSGSEVSIATGISSTSYTNTGLTNGTTYFYKVTAVNANGESGKSNEASATPSAGGGGNTHTGTWSCKGVMTTTASFKNISEVVSCASNSTYVGSIWIKGGGAVELTVKAGNWGANVADVRCNATSTWTQVSTSSFSTGSNTQLTFVLQDSYGVAGTAYIDDTFLGVSSGTNVLNNPGFESGNTGWSINGTVFSIGQF
jgi:fibronectin type 3 domain-containing protein